MREFIFGLDEYFSEKYENYDKLCVLAGYKMPKMQATEMRGGKTFSFTLPKSTMRLSLQENKEEILIQLKKRLTDKTFSFSFIPLRFFSRIRNKLDPLGFKKVLKKILQKKNMTFADIFSMLTIPEEVWKKVCNGNVLPTKNLILSIALGGNFTWEETTELLNSCNYEWDFSEAKDVVISYLVRGKIFNEDLVGLALSEYKVENLYLAFKKGESA